MDLIRELRNVPNRNMQLEIDFVVRGKNFSPPVGRCRYGLVECPAPGRARSWQRKLREQWNRGRVNWYEVVGKWVAARWFDRAVTHAPTRIGTEFREIPKITLRLRAIAP